MQQGLDLLGEQLTLVLNFLDSKCNLDLEFKDAVAAGQIVKAKGIFPKLGKGWQMRQESIPGDLAIKSVSFSNNALYLETAPLDVEKAKETIRAKMLPFSYDEKKHCFMDSSTEKRLASIGPVSKPTHEKTVFAPRCLWTIPLRNLDEIRRRAVVQLIDALYTADAYIRDGIELDDGLMSGERGRPDMKLLMSFQMQLEMEQRPMLSDELTVRQEQRLEIRQIFTLQNLILHMNEQQLIEWVVKETTEKSEVMTIRVLHFVLAGKIKRAQPKLTWKEARDLARKLASSTPV